MAEPPMDGVIQRELAQLAQAVLATNQNVAQLAQATAPLTAPRADGTADGNFRLQLPTFSAKAEEVVGTWLFQITAMFEAKNVPIDRRVALTMSILKDDALNWYFNLARRIGHVPDWEQFCALILRAYQPPNQEHLKRLELRALRQGSGTARAYAQKFRGILGGIQRMDPVDQVSYFIAGLAPYIARELNYTIPADIDAAINLALQYEAAQGTGSGGGPAPAVHRPPDPIPEIAPAPMEVNSMNRFMGICYRCGKVGHRAAWCQSAVKPVGFNPRTPYGYRPPQQAPPRNFNSRTQPNSNNNNSNGQRRPPKRNGRPGGQFREIEIEEGPCLNDDNRGDPDPDDAYAVGNSN